MSVSEYNRSTGSKYSVSTGTAMNIHADWVPGTFGVEIGDTHTVYGAGHSYSFEIISSGRGKWITEKTTFPCDSVFIINDAEYVQIYSEVTTKGAETNQIGWFHFIDFESWKKEVAAVEKIDSILTDEELPLNSVLGTYNNLKKMYSVFVFITSVMGILFFVAGGGVLCFKQFSELAEARKTFYKLFKIGITKHEMKRTIGNELLLIFFLPIIFGTCLGIPLIYIMTFLVSGDYVIDEFMKNSWIVVGVYFISQSIFYWITKNKYVQEITKEK